MDTKPFLITYAVKILSFNAANMDVFSLRMNSIIFLKIAPVGGFVNTFWGM